MILVSDRTQGAPGSLEDWSCRDCSPGSSMPHKTVEVAIDLTFDSDSDDGIQVVDQPQRVRQEVKRENREVLQESQRDRWEIKESGRESKESSAAAPAFELY